VAGRLPARAGGVAAAAGRRRPRDVCGLGRLGAVGLAAPGAALSFVC